MLFLTPPFLWSQAQFSSENVQQTETIASLRIHVERAIRRIKEHHFFLFWCANECIRFNQSDIHRGMSSQKNSQNSRFATTSKVWNPLEISMTLSRMSNKNNRMVKEKSSNWVKINYAWKCAEIDFSYKQDANIVNFQGKFATSSESARTKWEWYTVQLNFLL